MDCIVLPRRARHIRNERSCDEGSLSITHHGNVLWSGDDESGSDDALDKALEASEVASVDELSHRSWVFPVPGGTASRRRSGF